MSPSQLGEQIFLLLTAQGWHGWSAAVRDSPAGLPRSTPDAVAAAIAESLVARPLFCDLPAQAPLDLERNVSLDAAYEFTPSHVNGDRLTDDTPDVRV